MPNAIVYEVPLNKRYVHTFFCKHLLSKTNKSQLSPNFEIVLLVTPIAVAFSHLGPFTHAGQYITLRFYMYAMAYKRLLFV